MTGSGKSELLVSWVVALARAATPAEVNFLLVDFKGGSSFAAVSRLQHTVGLITDLDQAAAERALSSLRAELRHRERVLAAAGARSIDELSGGQRMPRLVIMVDEFAVVASEFPELQALFADLASRGRSLGIHLILCTQRPAGVVRDSVLANCSLRLSLRVNNGADSTAVVGTPDAAELPVRPAGRCLMSIGGGAPIALQVARATLDDVTELVGRYTATSHPVRRPWCEPLPAIVPLDLVVAGCTGPGLPFGLTDVPEAQSQPPAIYDPAHDGNLIVIGALGSGKSGTLATLQAACRMGSITPVRIPSDVEGAWDAVVAAVTELHTASDRSTLYLLDDLDALVGMFGQDHQLEFVDLLVRLMREGTGRGSRTVLSAGRVTSGIQSVVAQCDSRLILRMQNRQEHLLTGADPALYSPELPPGAGSWRGHRVQVALAPSEAPTTSTGSGPHRNEWPLHGQRFALVSPAAVAIAERIRSAGPPEFAGQRIVDLSGLCDGGLAVIADDSAQPRILAGSPADWQSQWSLFAAVRSGGPVVFAGCSVSEFRSLTGTRQLPPPLNSPAGAAWILGRDGRVIRARMP
jgi:S-DNA-T family DNA segregation ATPase FtsK/SpoIIIE